MPLVHLSVRQQRGRLFLVTSLSVGYSQADCRYGGISDVAVELQKRCVFLPGCFHYWHCKQEEISISSAIYIFFKKWLIQCISTAAGASLKTKTKLTALGLVYRLLAFERVCNERLIFIPSTQHHRVLDNYRIHNNFQGRCMQGCE